MSLPQACRQGIVTSASIQRRDEDHQDFVWLDTPFWWRAKREPDLIQQERKLWCKELRTYPVNPMAEGQRLCVAVTSRGSNPGPKKKTGQTSQSITGAAATLKKPCCRKHDRSVRRKSILLLYMAYHLSEVTEVLVQHASNQRITTPWVAKQTLSEVYKALWSQK